MPPRAWVIRCTPVLFISAARLLSLATTLLSKKSAMKIRASSEKPSKNMDSATGERSPILRRSVREDACTTSQRPTLNYGALPCSQCSNCNNRNARGEERRMDQDKPLVRYGQLWSPEVMEDVHVKAELGRYRIRGFSTLKKFVSFDELTFVPCTLSRIPLEGYREQCSTETVLGTRFAKKPIVLKTPITIAGMSFGAL